MAIDRNEATTHPGAVGAADQAGNKNWDGGDGGGALHPESMPSEVVSSNHSKSHCLHCNQQLISANELRTGFCCVGCNAAYELINGLGLKYFYELRERGPAWSAQPAKVSSNSFAHFDDPLFAKSFILTESKGVAKLSFQLPGIHCAACVWLLEKLPEVIPGIFQVRVNLVQGRATVRFHPESVKPSVIARAFNGLGYTPHPLSVDGTETKSSQSDRLFAVQLGVAGFSAMNVMLLFIGRHQGYLSGMEQQYAHFFAWVSLLLSLPVVFFSALPFFKTSWNAIRNGRLHIDLPIAIAILAGFGASAVNTILGRPEIYFDTVTALVFLLLLGRWFQRIALKRVGVTTDLLHSLAPLSATRINKDGTEQVYIESLQVGDNVLVKDGESFPCDGTISFGSSHANNSLITGESRNVPLSLGSAVFAGTKNVGAPVHVQVTSIGRGTRLGKLVEEIQSSPARESRTARFVDRISVYFVIGVLALSVVTFAIWIGSGFWQAWDHVIALLVVSCPCALGIATPVTLSLAGARAAKRGILIKDGEALERLARVDAVVFDKTGTLTRGELGIFASEKFSEQYSWEWVWGAVSALEAGVEHPVAEALSLAAETREISPLTLESSKPFSGSGVLGITLDGQRLKLGSLAWLQRDVEFDTRATVFINANQRGLNTLVGLSSNEKLVAIFVLSDVIRPEAQEVIGELSKKGINSTILSGDNCEVVKSIGEQLGIESERCKGEISPEDKSKFVQSLGVTAAFVGDGANDGLALSKAGVGIGISGGAAICMAVSDIFLLRPQLSLVVESIDGARDTLKQIHRHLGISLIYNIVAASLAVLGYIGPLAAALVMPLSSLTVITSSLWRAPFRGGSR